MFDVRSSARRRRLPPCSDILRLALTDHFDAIALTIPTIQLDGLHHVIRDLQSEPPVKPTRHFR